MSGSGSEVGKGDWSSREPDQRTDHFRKKNDDLANLRVVNLNVAYSTGLGEVRCELVKDHTV